MPASSIPLGSFPAALKPDDLVDLLQLSRGSVYAAIERGDIETVRVGRRILVPTVPLCQQFGIPLDVVKSEVDR